MKGFQKGDPRAREAGAKGGRVNGWRRRRAALAELKSRWPGIPPEAAAWVLTYIDRRARTWIQARKRAGEPRMATSSPIRLEVESSLKQDKP